MSPLIEKYAGDHKEQLLPSYRVPSLLHKRVKGRLPYTLIIVGIIAAIRFLSQWFSAYTFPIEAARFQLPARYEGHHPNTILNDTLGYEKVYVISLPNRLDKRDQLDILEHTSGLEWEIVDAFKGDDLKDTRLPYYSSMRMSPGMLGCYRSHINVWKKMLRDDVATALIMEDDVDFVRDIRNAMRKLQHPFASLITSLTPSIAPIQFHQNDPWGQHHWDIMQLGACTELPFVEKFARPWTRLFKEENFLQHPPYLIYSDITTPSREESSEHITRVFDEYKIPFNDTRMVTFSYEPWCTNAYAVTKQGAAKLLHAATKTMQEPVDVAIGFAIQDKVVKSYTILPPLFGQWKPNDDSVPSDRENVNASNQALSKAVDPWSGTASNIGKGYRSYIRELYS